MLETLFGEAVVLTGRLFSTYADLRASIIRSLDDKLSVSMVETSSLSTTNVVQNLAENTHKKVRRKSRGQHYARGAVCQSQAVSKGQRQGQKGRRAKRQKKANTGKNKIMDKSKKWQKKAKGKGERRRQRQHHSQDCPSEKQENLT